jgi:hypothetical protein
MFSLLTLLFLLVWVSTNTVAQDSPIGTLRGTLTDPSNAVIVNARVTVTGPAGKRSAKTNGQGSYEILRLVPGKYKVSAAAKSFLTFTRRDVPISSGQTQQLDITLDLPSFTYKITVKGQQEQEAPHVDAAPSANASRLVIRGKDLQALSDDPQQLQSELQALAGPHAGPNGGQIYIDGFTGGQLPPKSAIREIQVNENPFSAEYDKPGFDRIEIFTQPGTDHCHGQVLVSDTGSFINSKNPFIPAETQPGYQTRMFNANLSGPLTKRATFSLNAERQNSDDSNIIVAPAVGVEQAIPNPQTRTNVNLRLDYQLSANNTLTARYQLTKDNQANGGVGGLSLASQAYNSNNTEQTFEISDTQAVSSRTSNETRFQYVRDRNRQFVQDFSPMIDVLGAFVGGGNSAGNSANHQDYFEIQNYTTITLKKHSLKFGGRLREVRNAVKTNANFNGTFTFGFMGAYCPASAQIPCPAPGLPSQFSIVTGQPVVRGSLFDAGLFTQDDWSIRPNMTLSLGLRFETQTQIHDHADFAPRLAFAWALGHGKAAPKTVLRAGFGVFYERFSDDLLLQAEQLNGINQQQYIVNSPTFFPEIPPLSSLGVTPVPTKYQISPRLHSPYLLQSAITLERQLGKLATISVSYLNSHGFDQLVLRNINAPMPVSGIQPLGNVGNIYQYESAAFFKQHQLIANFKVNAGPKLSFFGFYSLGYAQGDTGAGTNTASSLSAASAAPTVNFLSNQYNILADHGRTAFDVRHQFTLGGSVALPHAFRLSPFVIITSGLPFNITVGQDLNGDSIFNDRPSFATGHLCGGNIQCTSLGTFNLNPGLNDVRIPINYGTGPGQFTFNVRLSKTFAFGKRLESGAAAGRPDGADPSDRGSETNTRYSLTFSVAASNLLNNVNLAPPIGVISSPGFGKSNALAGGTFGTTTANRRVDLQLMFSF